jgi:DNA-binding NarL/FixJ family response regulator
MSSNSSGTHERPRRENAPDDDHAGEKTAWQGSIHRARAQNAAAPVHLTRRELEVLTLLCQGLSNKLIARALHISGATVKTHVGSVLRALGVSSRLQAVVRARQWGLVQESTGLAHGGHPHRGLRAHR